MKKIIMRSGAVAGYVVAVSEVNPDGSYQEPPFKLVAATEQELKAIDTVLNMPTHKHEMLKDLFEEVNHGRMAGEPLEVDRSLLPSSLRSPETASPAVPSIRR